MLRLQAILVLAVAACATGQVVLEVPSEVSGRFANATVALYAGVDETQRAAYALEGQLFPADRLGNAEPCVRADNVTSTVPSVRIAPAYSAAAIAQRAALAGALASYVEGVSELLTTRVGSATPRFDVLRAATRHLAHAATLRPAGDLFVASEAAELRSAVDRLNAVRNDGAEARSVAVATAPVTTKLVTILQHDALAAAALAHDANASLAALKAAVPVERTGAGGERSRTTAGPAAPAVACTAPFAARVAARIASLPQNVQRAGQAGHEGAEPAPTLAPALTALAGANEALAKYAASGSVPDAHALSTALVVLYASI